MDKNTQYVEGIRMAEGVVDRNERNWAGKNAKVFGEDVAGC